MKKPILCLGLLAVFTCAGALGAQSVGDATDAIASNWLLAGVTGDAGRASIQGDKDLWIDVVLQPGVGGPGMATLKSDLRESEVGGQLRDAGYRVMDPKKKSMAFGKRPTLGISVFFSPKGATDPGQAFYLVIASASQDCKPLGGSKLSLITWAKVGEPILASGDDGKDADAIRVSVKACVRAFIDATRS